MVGRLLVDASCLVGLLKAGGLNVLHEAPGPVATTQTVMDEVVDAEFPETSILEEDGGANGGTLIEETSGEGIGSSIGPLGGGESSLFDAREEGDLLVLDDRAARSYARSRGWAFTGTIGLIVQSAESRWLEPVEASRLLEVLTRTDFRLTVDLYQEARERLEAAASGEL